MIIEAKSLKISYERYTATVNDMWQGKFIGGTFGAPFEGYKNLLDIDVRDLLPLKIVENDDTDLQLLWLHALEEHGIDLTPEQMVAEWREHVGAPWGEYGIARANWERGIPPPESGKVDNWFYGNGMGCPIRSEIWGIICPGMPERAALYARQDAELDHHDESVEAEVFLASLQAAIFIEKDLHRLIEIGLGHVNPESRLASLIGKVLEWVKDKEWKEIRQLILRDFGHPDFTNSLQNMGFILLALLKGEGDFILTMNIAINCSYDTDCTAATAGAILNAIRGSEHLPESIRSGITDTYMISDWMHGFPRTGSMKALTHASCGIGRQVVSRYSSTGETGIRIMDPASPPVTKPLPVSPCNIEEQRPVQNPFPDWLVMGPYFRDLKEIAKQSQSYPDHGDDKLPSVKYMTQMHSAFDTSPLDPSLLSLPHSGYRIPEGTFTYPVKSSDSRLILENLPDAGGPCTYYALTSFESPEAGLNWLLVGSTGPIEVWLNGSMAISGSSYQPLAPCTFEQEVELVKGLNQIVLKLEKTSQPVQAAILFKWHSQEHWHQCYYNTSLEWKPVLGRAKTE